MRFRMPSIHAAGWGWPEHPSCINPAWTCATDSSSFRFGLPPGTYTFEGTWYLHGIPSFFPPFTAPTITRTITFTR
jgi:hypothetical protein